MFNKFKYKLLLFLNVFLYFVAITGFAQTEKNINVQAGFLLGYKAGNSNGLNIGSNLTFNKKIGLEFRLTQSFFTEMETSIPFFLNKSNNQLFIYAGYGFYKKGNLSSYRIEINSINTGLGYKSEIGKKFFINTRLSFVKYLNESYKSNEITLTETYNVNEKLYIELSLSVGYYISLNSLHKK